MWQRVGETEIREDWGLSDRMGDQRKMAVEANSFWHELRDRENRTIFNRIWAPQGAEIARDTIDQLGMYPTVLELVGIELSGHRAGIGVSALASDNEVSPGSVRDLDAQQYRDVVSSRATKFYAIWAAQSPVVASG